ncbi:MAG: hypothetical protein U0Y10_12260 [Spirosomataceae bacterium]
MLQKSPYLLLPIAILSLLLGVWTGWLRMGWALPIPPAVAHHGALMIGGFLGTLISTERAAVLKHPVGWLGPIAFASSMPLLIGNQPEIAFIVMTVGGVAYLLIMSILTYRFLSPPQVLMLIGAVFQLIANVALLLTHSYPMAFAAWLAFLLFTIVGERLDLCRFLPVGKVQYGFLYGLLVVFVAGLFLYHRELRILNTLSLVGIALWLMRYDIAYSNLAHKGHYRFMGLQLLLGYGWLLLTGILAYFGKFNPLMYDAVLHSFFVGFILSMIMAHAAIILPSVIGLRIRPYHASQYMGATVVHLSLLIRLLGDVLQNPTLRQWGGLFNGLGFLIFWIATILTAIRLLRKTSTHSHSLVHSHE